MTFIPPVTPGVPRQTKGEFSELRRDRFAADAEANRQQRAARQQRRQRRRGWLWRLLRRQH